MDDRTLKETRRLIAERPGKTVVIWERGLTAWRKVAYYSPGVEVVVLEHKKIRSGSPPVIAIWKGAKLERRLPGGAPLQLPAGTRIVWLLNPQTDFFSWCSRISRWRRRARSTRRNCRRKADRAGWASTN